MSTKSGLIFLICCTMVCLGVIYQWWHNEKDITRFITAGSKHTLSGQTPVPIYIYEGDGYDGQLFFRYALNPFSTANPAYGVLVDAPHYRHPRIMYPLLVWMVTGGQAPIMPYAMVLVNFLAYAGLCLLGIRLCKEWNVRPKRILFVLFIPGLWMCLFRNLSELTEALFFFWAILAFTRGNKWGFSLAAAAMLFSRESSGIVLLALFPAFFLSRNGRQGNQWLRSWVIPVIVPVLLLTLFRWGISQAYEVAPTTAQAFEIVPLRGFKQALQYQGMLQGNRMGTLFSSWGVLAGFTFTVFVFSLAQMLRNKQKDVMQLWLQWIVIIWMIFLLFLSRKVWIDYWAFCRAFTIPMLTCGLLWVRMCTAYRKQISFG